MIRAEKNMNIDELINDSFDWFEIEHPLISSLKRRVILFNNNQREYENKADVIAEHMLSDKNLDASIKNGAVFIGYGYSTGAFESNNKIKTITHQHLYQDTPVWFSNISASLNIDVENIYYSEGYTDNNFPDDDELRKTEIGEFIKWLVNPSGNTEIACDVIRKICVPMVKEITNKFPPRSQKNIQLVVPLISNQIENLDWNSIFKEVQVDNTKLIITNQTSLFTPNDNERLYVIFRHQWTFDTAYIVQAIEKSQKNDSVSIGAYAFFSHESSKYYELKNQQQTLLTLNSLTNVGGFDVKPKTLEQNIFNVNSKLQFNDGFRSFLGTHESTFYELEFSRISSMLPNGLIQRKIFEILPAENMISYNIATICASICNETNLLNISLSDMVSIGIALENRGSFQSTDLTTNKTFNYVSNTYILPLDNYQIESFPSNYGSFRWRCRNNVSINDYYQFCKSDIKNVSIDCVLQKIISFFNAPTTSDVAEEFLFIYTKEKDSMPTALFTAKLFGYLCQNDEFVIVSKSYEVNFVKNEIIHCSSNDFSEKDNLIINGQSYCDQIETSIMELWNDYQKKENTPLIVVKRIWNNDYCFAVERIDSKNNMAYGRTFRGGRVYSKAGYSLSERLFVLYDGPSKNIIYNFLNS